MKHHTHSYSYFQFQPTTVGFVLTFSILHFLSHLCIAYIFILFLPPWGLFLKEQWTLELEYSILLFVLSHITHTTISAWSVTSRWTFDCWLNSSFTFPFFPQDLCLGKPIAKLIYSLSWCWWKDPNYAWEPSSQPQPQLQLNSSQLPLLILWRHF